MKNIFKFTLLDFCALLSCYSGKIFYVTTMQDLYCNIFFKRYLILYNHLDTTESLLQLRRQLGANYLVENISGIFIQLKIFNIMLQDGKKKKCFSKIK